MKVMLSVTGPGPLWTSRTPQRHNPRYKPRSARCSRVREGGGDALRRPRRPLPDLERAEQSRAGSSRSRPACRQRVRRRPRRTSTAGSCARRRRRSSAPTRARRCCSASSRRAGTGRSRRARPSRRCRSCARWRAWTGATSRLRRRALPRASSRRGRTPSATTRTASSSGPRTRTRTATRPRSATCRGCSAVLDRLTRMGRIGAPRRKFDVYLTEFSYQTSPPDHEVGVSLGRQARYLQQAAYLAWRLPRVRNLTQYQWRDEPVIVRGRGVKSYSGWQSGLRYVNDKPKPAMRAFLRAVRDRRRPARAGREVLGPDPPGERRADGHGAAAAAGPEGVPARRRRCRPTRAATGRGGCRSSGGRSTASRGRRPGVTAGADRRRARLSGVVEVAGEPGAALARVAVSDFRDVLHGGLLAAGPGRGRADGALAGAGRAVEGGPRRRAVRAGGAAAGLARGDRLRGRGAAGRARGARGGAGARRLRALAAGRRAGAGARRGAAGRGVRRP